MQKAASVLEFRLLGVDVAAAWVGGRLHQKREDDSSDEEENEIVHEYVERTSFLW
jgi:hypothetical protein